jgi:hypothetical protein
MTSQTMTISWIGRIDEHYITGRIYSRNTTGHTDSVVSEDANTPG